MSKISIIKDAAEKAMEAEFSRTEYLLGKAEKFVASVAVVMGFQLFDVKSLLKSSSLQVEVLFLLAFIVLIFSLFFSLCSMRVKNYVNYPRGNKLWHELEEEAISETNAEEIVAKMLLKAREHNAQLNDEKARLLFWNGWLLLIGYCLVLSSQLLAALR
ncbi:MAG TPA: hypothetical protein VMG59_09930 [Phycisphaerae bacterium]|nr:hypothetical protein [Phycisphaerae bacterium]